VGGWRGYLVRKVAYPLFISQSDTLHSRFNLPTIHI